MPRYVYQCNSCDGHFQVRHGMKERQESCQLCEEVGYLQRVPQMPILKKGETTGNQSTGTLTKDYIEKNRELLRDMKKEARNQKHDD